MKRVFLIVLDSCGAGAAPDSEKFGDIGVHTIESIHSHPDFSAVNMKKIGS